ncbi:hypothetical protein [Francisella sp. SYW-2]|uniref:hypothetical protein n=1 Tax=Francisella sp. SYW-2 TaxID=2610886 RepID=UPI00123E05F3|nr:hypothetical protein [Francisella sp. SYW-2]
MEKPDIKDILNNEISEIDEKYLKLITPNSIFWNTSSLEDDTDKEMLLNIIKRMHISKVYKDNFTNVDCNGFIGFFCLFSDSVQSSFTFLFEEECYFGVMNIQFNYLKQVVEGYVEKQWIKQEEKKEVLEALVEIVIVHELGHLCIARKAGPLHLYKESVPSSSSPKYDNEEEHYVIKNIEKTYIKENEHINKYFHTRGSHRDLPALINHKPESYRDPSDDDSVSD